MTNPRTPRRSGGLSLNEIAGLIGAGAAALVAAGLIGIGYLVGRR